MPLVIQAGPVLSIGVVIVGDPEYAGDMGVMWKRANVTLLGLELVALRVSWAKIALGDQVFSGSPPIAGTPIMLCCCQPWTLYTNARKHTQLM